MKDKIIGNTKQIKYLDELVESENISHAYAFTGIEGIGKQLIARYFSEKILKQNNLNSSPDFRFIEKAEDAKEIQVDIIRDNLIADIYKKPIISDRKVYIINDANKMNVAAQNVLLKTLEEPPKYVTIILVSTTVDAFLPTIKSRLKEIKFSKLSKKEILSTIDSEHLENIDNIEFLLDYSNGSIGKFKKVIEKENLEKIKVLDNYLNVLEEKNIVKAMIEGKNINFKEQESLNYMQYCYLKKYESTLDFKYVKCIEILENTKEKYKFNGNEEIVLDNMIINIIKEIS